MTKPNDELHKEFERILPKKRKFSVRTRMKYGDDHINKIIWENRKIDSCTSALAERVVGVEEIAEILVRSRVLYENSDDKSVFHKQAIALTEKFIIIKKGE